MSPQPKAPSPSLKLLVAIPVAAIAALLGSVLGIAVLAGANPGCGGGEAVGGLSAKVPARLAPLHVKAASRYRLGARGPSILAAINLIESGFGANTGPSSAGAEGPMQFIPSTWAAYGVDGDDDGDAEISDPADAIFAAANYLHASGAPSDWHAAILAYNHAEWYFAEVDSVARRFSAPGSSAAPEVCLAAPNDAVARMLAEARRLDAMRPHTEYVWGGSHGETPTPPDGPFDCSSAVSHLLQVGGFHNPTMDTTMLVGWGDAGPGHYLTIYVKPYGSEAHTFLEFASGIAPPSERYWGTSGLFAGKGPGFIAERDFSPAYLAGFERRHPPGL